MKIPPLVLIFISVSTPAGHSTCTSGDFKPDYTNSNRYYRCESTGEYKLQNCAPTLVWNDKTKTCSYKSSWTMRIYKSSDNGTATSDNVYLQAVGGSGVQSEKTLVKIFSGLEQGKVSVKISLPDFDRLERITFQRAENGPYPPWKVEKIELQKDNDPIQYVFQCHCWINSSLNGTSITVEPKNVMITTGTEFIFSPKYDVTSVPMTNGSSPRRNEETTGTGFISSPKDDVTSVPMTGGTLLRSSSGVTRTIEVAPPTVENTKQSSNKDTTSENPGTLVSQTPAPPVTRSNAEVKMCVCPCENTTDIASVAKNTSLPKEIEEKLQKMIMEMKVDKETLSKYVRQKTSAEDKRPSAVAIGSAGVVLLVIPLVIIVLFDLVSLLKYTSRRNSQSPLLHSA